MKRSERVKLFGLIILLAGFVLLATLPEGSAKADGAGGFPTSTAAVIVFPTDAPSPTAPTILSLPSPSPYPFPVPQDNSLNMMLPESQADTAIASEDSGGFSTYLCIPVVIVAVLIALIGLNRIRKNYQGE